MSRVGRNPITVPAQVKVDIRDSAVAVEGPKGKLSITLPAMTSAELSEGVLRVSRTNDTAKAKANHGLGRALLQNMVRGVHEGYVLELEIQGVGFKADVKDAKVNLALGYSHPINYPIPAGVTVTVQDGTKVKVEGCDKQKVGQVAADIRGFYPAEPYKGKGVRYNGEQVRRKEGKTVQ